MPTGNSVWRRPGSRGGGRVDVKSMAGALALGAIMLVGAAPAGRCGTGPFGVAEAGSPAPGKAGPKAAAAPADPRQVATKLRRLYFARDFEGAVVEGRKAMARIPDPGEARAWYLLSLAAIFGEEDGAVGEAEKWVASSPLDPWARFALAGTLDEDYDRFGETLPASRKAFALAKRHPDFIRLHAMVLSGAGRPQEALDLIDRSLPRAGNPADLLALKGDVLLRMSPSDEGESREAIRAGAFALFQKAREADPSNVYAHYRPGYLLAYRHRTSEGLPLLRRAAELSPFSSEVHERLWGALMGQTDVAPEKKSAEVEADIRSLLHGRGDYPGTLLAVSQQYGEMGLKDRRKEIDARILRQFPDSREAEWVLVNRQRDFAGEHRGEEMKKPAVQAEYRGMLRDFIKRPNHRHEALLGEAYLDLFFSLRDDPGVNPDELLDPIRGMLQHEKTNLHTTFPAAACALADRKAHLEEAERIVRDGFAAVEREGERGRAYRYGSRKEQRGWVRHLSGLMLDASGWVHFNQGRTGEAVGELEEARRILKQSEVNLFHLGRVAEARGDADGAEKLYAKGMAVQRPGENPCVKALQDLYVKRFGSLQGFDSYAGKFKEEDRAKRKELILAERIAAPEAIEAFDLKGLDGARVSTGKLRGKILVINFWGVWCGWCLEEMPEIQKLFEKYRGDPEVAILTIDNDPNPETVREWMKKKGFSFPVLLDDGYVSEKAKVNGFPTTWFVDREGRKVFDRIGWSKELLEEYGWRIDALRGAPPG